MSWTKRKIASKLTPTIVFSFPDSNTINIAFSTSVMTRSQSYTIKGTTKHKGQWFFEFTEYCLTNQ